MEDRDGDDVGAIACIEPFDSLFAPYGFEGVDEANILALVVSVSWSVLAAEDDTNMLSRERAMSSGLQTVTEMKPPSSPATKFTAFWEEKICLRGY